MTTIYDIWIDNTETVYNVEVTTDVILGDSIKVRGVLRHRDSLVVGVLRDDVSQILNHMDEYLDYFMNHPNLEFIVRPQATKKIEIVFDNTVLNWLNK